MNQEPTNVIAALRLLLRQLFCRHTHGQLIGIEWDGTSVYECSHCGKHIRKGL